MSQPTTTTAKGCPFCGHPFRLPGTWQVCADCDCLLPWERVRDLRPEPSPVMHDQGLCFRDRCPFCFEEGAGA